MLSQQMKNHNNRKRRLQNRQSWEVTVAKEQRYLQEEPQWKKYSDGITTYQEISKKDSDPGDLNVANSYYYMTRKE
jgi:hypothetical protein